MKSLHDRLMDRKGHYHAWHNTPHHGPMHALVLTLVSLVAFAGVLSALGSSAAAQNALAAAGADTPSTKGRAVGVVPDHILVKYKTSDNAAIQSLEAKYKLTEKKEIAALGIKILKLPPAGKKNLFQRLLGSMNLISDGGPVDVAAQIRRSEKSTVEFAEADIIYEPSAIPNDPKYSSQWSLPKIAAPAAWDTTTGNPSVTVAILDTGVNSAHEDLASKVVPGWNFYDNNADTRDVYGHGTGVAGIAAAATNNSLGVAGAGWNVKYMPIRISAVDGGGSSSAMADGLVFAADNGARVANISYRMSTNSTVTNAAKYFQSHGGVVAISAGNQGEFITTADNPSVLTVGATDSSDNVTTWSNKGNIIDLVAPGVSLYSPFWTGGYGTGSGTSMSAPLVAGVAALVISANPNLTAVQIQDVLKQSADDFGATGWDTSYGWGRLNAAKAVALAINPTTPGGGGSTSDTAAPSAPTNLVATATDSSKVTLTWTPSLDNVGVTGYKIYRDNAELATSTVANYSDTKIAAAKTYSYTVKAYDAAGNYSPTSNTATITVPDTIAPTVPANLTSSDITDVSATLTWNASTDNVGVTGYRIFRNNAIVTTTGNTTYTDGSLTANTGYTYAVAAIDGAGNQSVKSSAITVTTGATGGTGTGTTGDTIAPTVTIASPKAGAKVNGNITISATATDNIGVTKVELYVDGVLTDTSTTSPFNTKWNTGKASKGTHSLVVKAYDAAGNVGTSVAVSVTK